MALFAKIAIVGPEIRLSYGV